VSIKQDALNVAVSEAKRFLILAEIARKDTTHWSSPAHAAVKRSSMDLTRALAVLRK